MRLIDADAIDECKELMTDIKGDTVYAVKMSDIRELPTVCDIEDIRAEIKSAKLKGVNDCTERATNHGLNTALVIIDKHTK